MQKTLMVGLNEKDMGAVIHNYDLKAYYYPTLFPLKETNRLDWKMLEAQAGLKIAADLVSRGSSIPRKTREAIARIQGDIPKISISREKLEDELTEYDIMVALASNNPDLTAIVEFWAEDTKFCWDGVAARAEWIALQEISLGRVKFTNSNNAAVDSGSTENRRCHIVHKRHGWQVLHKGRSNRLEARQEVVWRNLQVRLYERGHLQQGGGADRSVQALRNPHSERDRHGRCARP